MTETKLRTFSLESRPGVLVEYRKTGTALLSWQTEPFVVETQEGLMTISPETVEDWEDGYWISYPSDGSKPYAISRAFVRSNYTPMV